MAVVRNEVACKSLLLSYPKIFLNKEVQLSQLVPLWLPYFVEGKDLLCIFLLLLLPHRALMQLSMAAPTLEKVRTGGMNFQWREGKSSPYKANEQFVSLEVSVVELIHELINTCVNCFPENFLSLSPKYVDSNHSFFVSDGKSLYLTNYLWSPKCSVEKTMTLDHYFCSKLGFLFATPIFWWVHRVLLALLSSFLSAWVQEGHSCRGCLNLDVPFLSNETAFVTSEACLVPAWVRPYDGGCCTFLTN